MKIAICDDDLFIVGIMDQMLTQIGKEEKIPLEVETFSDGKNLWDEINRSGAYDLIYLDIEMDQMDGITVAKNIRRRDLYTILIFVSSHDSYCKQLFDVEPFRFLDKPIEKEIFRKYFRAAYARLTDANERFVFQAEKKFYQIPYKEIIYIESEMRMICIHATSGEYEFYAKLNDVGKKIHEKNRYFIRIHRSYMVNFQYIRSMNMREVVLITGEVLPVSPKYKDEAMQKYMRLLNF